MLFNWYMDKQTLVYQSVIKKGELTTTTLMDPKNIMLTERNQEQSYILYKSMNLKCSENAIHR